MVDEVSYETHEAPAVIRVSPGVTSRIHYGVLAMYARCFRHWGAPGLGRLADATGKFFPATNRIVARIFGQRLLEVRLGDGYWIAPVLRRSGYEPEVAFFLSQVLDGGVRFVDCGANVGYWSLFASTLLPFSAIDALEPAPSTYEALVRNASLNPPGFRCHQRVVWDEPGQEVSLAVDRSRHAWSTAEPTFRESLGAAGFLQVKVPTVTLDELCQPFDHRFVIKLDLEGSEARALKGARSTLDADVCFVYEQHGNILSVEATEILLDNGFSIGIVHDRRLETLTLDQARQLRDDRGFNLFAFRTGSTFGDRLHRDRADR